MLFWDLRVFYRTLSVAAVCLMFLGVFYSLSRLCKSIAWGLAGLYGSILSVVYFQSVGVNALFYVMAGAACVYTIKFLRIDKAKLWASLAAGVLGAITILGVRGAYTSFNMLERLVVDSVHQDTFFHASIAAMIKNYGIASTGLHGLVETPYHVLCHWLVAGISSLSGVSVFEVYGLAPQLFFIPMLFFCLGYFCVFLNLGKENINVAVLWGLICLALTFATYPFNNSFGMFNSYFTSESYTVSLGLFMLGLTLLYKHHLSLADIILACLLAMLITSAKASVGLIYMGLWWIRALFFMEKGRGKIIFSTLLLSGLVAITVFASASASTGHQAFGPFKFIEDFSLWVRHIRKARQFYAETGSFHIRYLFGSIISILLFVAVHFFMSWLAIGQSVYKKGWIFLWRSPMALYSLGAILAGMFIISLFNIPGGSAYYFSNVAFFVSLPAVLILCYAGLERLFAEQTNQNTNMLIVLVSACALVSMTNYSPMRKLFKEHSGINKELNSFIETLVSIRKNSEIDQYFVPSQSLIAQNNIKRITAKPFVYPAVSERPWVNVVVENDTKTKYQWYSYEQYGITKEKQHITIDPVLRVNSRRNLQLVKK